MEKMGVDFQDISIGRLQLAQLLRLRLVRVDRETLVHEQVPDLFPLLPGIKRLVLRVTDPAELFVRRGRLGAVALADELDDTFALIDLLTQHLAQVASFGAEDVLPDRLVTQESQRVGDELPRAAQLLAHRGNEDGRSR